MAPKSSSDLPIAAELLALLACPACDERPAVQLTDDKAALRCPVCRRIYPIQEGIPVMIPDTETERSD